MADTTPFTIGTEAYCTDGSCGRATQVVLDPLDNSVTHLIIEPDHRQGLGRLVPVEYVTSGADQIALSCTKAEFEKLEAAEQTRFLPGVGAYPGYDPEQTVLWPYFGGNSTVPVTFDTIPVGEVAVRRGERVHASDGEIGRVEGLVVDTASHHVTHVLLQEGHLFGRKEVAIPIAAVTTVGEDGISVSLNKHDVAALPAVEVNHPDLPGS